MASKLNSGAPRLASRRGMTPYLHSREAAAMIGCCDMTVRRLCHAGELVGFRLTDRGYLRIERTSVERFIRERKRRNFDGKGDRRR